MMNGGNGAPNYKRQRPSQMGLDVGAQLAQRSQILQAPSGGMPMEAAPVPQSPPRDVHSGDGSYDPVSEHSATSTRVALSEAVGRSLSVRAPENPRFRSRFQRQQWKTLGIPDAEIEMLEANDPAMREE